MSEEGVARMKSQLQHLIRSVHVALLRRPLPEKMSLYLHSTKGYEHRLDELLGFLRDHGYVFYGPDEFLRVSGKAAFLSFDDNYRSWMEALPVLDRYRARAMFYVNSQPFRDRVGASEMQAYLSRIRAAETRTLATAELRELAAAGHGIGAHTHTHPVLSSLPLLQAQEEIRVSKEELQSVLQQPVRDFAYPFGMRRHFSRTLRHYCRSIGFRTVANAIPCMQYAISREDSLHRSPWFLDLPLAENLDNLRTDGRVFQALTGRSAVGAGPSS